MMLRILLYLSLMLALLGGCALNAPPSKRVPASIKSHSKKVKKVYRTKKVVSQKKSTLGRASASIKSHSEEIQKVHLAKKVVSKTKSSFKRAPESEPIFKNPSVTSCLVLIKDLASISKLRSNIKMKYLDKLIDRKEYIHLIFKADLSSGALRNEVVRELNKLSVKAKWLETRIIFRGHYNSNQVDDFTCRVELARYMGELFLHNQLNPLPRLCSPSSGDIRAYKKKNYWGITLRTSGTLGDASEMRSTLDAIEYKMSTMKRRLVNPLRSKEVSRSRWLKIVDKNPSFNYFLYPWASFEVIPNGIAGKSELTLSRIDDRKYSDDEQLEIIKDFLIESGIYRSILESIGISVP